MRTAGRRTLLLLSCLTLGVAGAVLGERVVPPRQEIAPQEEVAREPERQPAQETPKVTRRFESHLERMARRFPPAPPAPAPLTAARGFLLREYVDLTGRISRYPARVNGRLWLEEGTGRLQVQMWFTQLLEGSARMGRPDGTATGRYRREGDEVIVEGLDLVIEGAHVFGPRDEVRRWRVAREEGATVLHATPFTFELRDAP